MSTLGDMSKSDTLITPMQAAMRLQVNPRTIARWADDPDHELTVAEYTDGGQRRFRLADVERLALKREQAA